MLYTKHLPDLKSLEWLARLSRPFPRSRHEIVEIARKWHFDDDVVDFLMLFPEFQTYDGIDDFLTRCAEVELLMKQERVAPKEYLRSPQD